MKPLPSILVTIVIVAAGILIYDAVRTDEPHVVGNDSATRPGATGDPSLGDTPAERLEARLARAEEQLETQGREMASLRQEELLAARSTDSAGPNALGGTEPAPPTSYDEKTLAALKVHLEELNRRRREDAHRNQLTAALDRLSLSLDASQRSQLVKEALRYQVDAGERWRELQAGGVRDPAELRGGLEKVRRSFVDRIRPLVAPDDLDRVVNALIGGAGTTAAGTRPAGTSAPGR